MKPIELKPGLSIDGDYALISCPKIASMFIGKEISKHIFLIMISNGYWYTEGDDVLNSKYQELYPLKIPRSLINKELKPVEGTAFFYWMDFWPDYFEPKYCNIYKYVYRDEVKDRIFVKSSELTLNLNIEKLNLLVNWSQE